jgi:hypothetical protein
MNLNTHEIKILINLQFISVHEPKFKKFVDKHHDITEIIANGIKHRFR